MGWMSQYVEGPSKSLCTAVKHLFCYIGSSLCTVIVCKLVKMKQSILSVSVIPIGLEARLTGNQLLNLYSMLQGNPFHRFMETKGAVCRYNGLC